MSDFFSLQEPGLWMTLAFFTLFALFGRKVLKTAVDTLDKRSAKIESDLNQAANIRSEAEALLQEYTQKSLASMKDAENIMSAAREQANSLIANAESEIKKSMDKRLEQAYKKLEDEETKALENVRNHVVDITIAAAKNLVSEHFSNMSGDEMVRYVVSDIERKLH